MRRQVAAFAVCVVLLVAACARPTASIIGEWKDASPSGTFTLILNADHSAGIFDPADQTVSVTDEKRKIEWHLDAVSSPHRLTIVATDTDGNKNTLRMIVRLIGSANLQVRMSEDSKDFPASFVDNDRWQMILSRK
jgi:uncharacterized protein (TIGR03067 family)